MKIMNDSYIQEPIGRVMSKIARLFLSSLHQNLSHLDIKRAYYPLLIIEAGNGNITQQELAQKLACDKVQVVRIIDYLSSLDYVTRVQDLKDRRKYKLEVTRKAIEALPDIKRAIHQTTSKTFETISDKEITQLYSILNRLEKNLINTSNIDA
jgi:DNA-binding MarR family transcriptional regulator